MSTKILMKSTDGCAMIRPILEERNVIKISVRPSAKQALEKLVSRYGMSQQEIASRAYEWLAAQDETTQAAVLDLLPREHVKDIAKVVLAKLADQRRNPGRSH